MFVFISHLTVPEPDRPALERHFRERSRLVDDFPARLLMRDSESLARAVTEALYGEAADRLARPVIGVLDAGLRSQPCA